MPRQGFRKSKYVVFPLWLPVLILNPIAAARPAPAILGKQPEENATYQPSLFILSSIDEDAFSAKACISSEILVVSSPTGIVCSSGGTLM
jgi:hypothetical protein